MMIFPFEQDGMHITIQIWQDNSNVEQENKKISKMKKIKDCLISILGDHMIVLMINITQIIDVKKELSLVRVHTIKAW